MSSESSSPQPQPHDDTELLAACARRDEAAWGKLVRQYSHLVYSTALSTGLGEDDVSEVYQQVWCELMLSLLRIRDVSRLPRWLVVTTRRIAYRHAIVQRRWVDEVRDDLIDPSTDADDRIVAMEQRYQVERALTGLDERCQRLLRMLFEQDASYDEVSQRLNMAKGTIGPARARCIARMRTMLEDMEE